MPPRSCARASPQRAAAGRALELDTFDGQAWLSIVPFRMARTGVRLWPTALGPHTFPELNVRTYVKAIDRAPGRATGQRKLGVLFFSLDAASPLAVFTARRWYHLPYFRARMTCELEPGVERVRYASERTHPGAPPAILRASYGPTGPARESAPGSLEEWLTERYCLYAVDRELGVWRSDIHHQKWPLRDATVELERNDLASCHGFALPPAPPLLQYAQNLDVVAWSPQRVT